MQELHEQYGAKVEVIGFPSNDFGGQEPGTNEEIENFCTGEYKATFLMSEKINIKGPEPSPIYKWLTTKALNGKLDSEVKWNFQKYLIDENGNLMDVFYSKTLPTDTAITNKL
nr:glutathione peroxidase [Bacteroidota bacterium]